MKKLVGLYAICTAAFLSTEAQQITDHTMPGIIQTFERDINDLQKVYIFKDSPEYFGRMNTYYNEQLQQLSKLPYSKFDIDDQVDYILLKRRIDKLQLDLRNDEKAYKEIANVVPFADKIITLQKARRRGNTPNPEADATTMNSIQKEIQQLINTKTPLTQAQAGKAVQVIESLRYGLQNTFDFYNGYNPQYTWWVNKPYHDADSMLKKYAGFVRSQAATTPAGFKDDGSGIKGTPIGSEALKDLLQYEMIPYSAEELVAIANKEFAWCDAEMLKAAASMGFGKDWKKALDKVKENYVAPGLQPALINRLAEEAIRYVDSAKLVTIPTLAREVWRMSMLTAEQQRFAPFFLGGESILIAYPTDEMDDKTKHMSLRSNNYGFAHATVFHELIPGHNLQGFMNARYKTYRQRFTTPFSIEGWALYWEMLLWDKGFHATPEEKVGALFWRMHRCARIIFSLNYHLGKWTPQQCIDFLVDRVGHERHSATSEVRRSFEGNYGPLYQIAYMMGGLQLRALYNEMVAKGKVPVREFHDTYLQQNAIPNEMFRAIIMKEKLPRDFKTNWRFADALLQ
ncbi:uncharacterized protein DUF885 [Chitinophaga skermanii]|uniref:Uncharacterized protein DUF885 n=1 Tax=Chitinophaga skermanii TaxID=331697 RepID=A0A327QY43_9BACT|nr:DUF885 family protein [Chitinophaga skermanii]RAJ08532.1 uncharacterized protein DUF885 [Chitinophaga skermanii]